jgi:hypothetical protein
MHILKKPMFTSLSAEKKIRILFSCTAKRGGHFPVIPFTKSDVIAQDAIQIKTLAFLNGDYN